jgi:hypothetical protein
MVIQCVAEKDESRKEHEATRHDTIRHDTICGTGWDKTGKSEGLQIKIDPVNQPKATVEMPSQVDRDR